MTDTATTNESRPAGSNTLRVRRHRERRRERLRQLTVEVPEAVFEQAIGRGMLKPEESAVPWDVIQACYAAQLSDAALDRLISGGVITREEHNDAVAILRRISRWLEQTDMMQPSQ
jgi:hypothetical protein